MLQCDDVGVFCNEFHGIGFGRRRCVAILCKNVSFKGRFVFRVSISIELLELA